MGSIDFLLDLVYLLIMAIWLVVMTGLIFVAIPMLVKWMAETLVGLLKPRRLKSNEVVWVVNSLGELGVKIGDQFFFLYKGESLAYQSPIHDLDSTPMKWRRVEKREFGETAKAPAFQGESICHRNVYDHGSGWEILPPQSSE